MRRWLTEIGSAALLASLASTGLAQSGTTGAERSPGGTVQTPDRPRLDTDAEPGATAGNGSSDGSGGTSIAGETLTPISPDTCRQGWSAALRMAREIFEQACRSH